MNYSVMTTEQLETLKAFLEEKLDGYVCLSFMSNRSELVSYEIDSFDSDSIMITANHYFDGLIREYIVDISEGVNDDVEYNHYNSDEEITDGGYMSFDRLQKNVRQAVCEIYSLCQALEQINNILDTRSEEDAEDAEEEDAEEDVKEEDVKEEDVKEKGVKEKEDKGVHTMNRIDAYNAYTVNRDFRYIANALGFSGFDYDDADFDFKAKLENDDKLSDLLEQLEDVESSQLLIYSRNATDFYQKHEYDIISYLKTYGYDDDYHIRSIEDIMCSRVVAYVTGVISEYVY